MFEIPILIYIEYKKIDLTCFINDRKKKGSFALSVELKFPLYTYFTTLKKQLI